MPIQPLQLPSSQLITPQIDFSPLGNLGKVYQNAQNERTLADVGKGLADGTMDYKTAAGQIASTGNLAATYQFLQLAESKDKLKRETEAGNNFATQLGSFFGGGQPAAAAPAASPQPQNNPIQPAQPQMGVPQATAPLPMNRAPVASSPKVWGDAEAEAAGLYEPRPGQPAQPQAQPMSLASLGNPQSTGAVVQSVAGPQGGPSPSQARPAGTQGMPQSAPMPGQPQQIAAAAPAAAPGASASASPRFGAAQIPMLVQALANPDTPAGHKEIAKTFLTRALDDSKPNEKIQYLQQLKDSSGYKGTPLELEMELRRASKTEVNVDTKGQNAFAVAGGGAIAKRFEKLSEEGDTANTDLALIGQLRDLGQVVKTGAPAAIQGWLANNGIKVGDNVGAVEAYGAIIDKLTPQQRIPGSGATSDYEGKMFKNSLQKLMNTPEGNEMISNTLAGLAQNKIERAKIAEQALAGDLKPGDALKQLRELPSPYANFKDFAKRGFRADPNSPASASPPIGATSQPAASAAPPSVQGAKRASDGNYYVPDPQRPGKYLQVQ